MWCLILDKNKLNCMLEVIAVEYITNKKQPATNKSVEQLRIHLVTKIENMIKNREMFKTINMEIDDVEKIVDDFCDNISIREKYTRY